MRVVSTPFCLRVSRVRPSSSTLVYGPTRTRCHTPLSGSVAVWMRASTPSSASRALRVSASRGFWNAPAWRKNVSPAVAVDGFLASFAGGTVTGSSVPGRIL
jgi:hypothetical protein